MAKVEDANARLDEVEANLTEIGTETDGLIAEVVALKAEAEANRDNVPDAVIERINAIAVRAKAIADKVPNVTPPPDLETPVGEGTGDSEG